jgi:predicted NUDIX family phosphoesterase
MTKMSQNNVSDLDEDRPSELLNGTQKTSEVVMDKILEWIEEELREETLSITKSSVVGFFSGKKFKNARETDTLIQAFLTAGNYQPRETLEADENRVQALPVVVVRNSKGDVLRLQRKEKKSHNPLHKKIVIWAGGHVSKEDNTNGNSLLQCAVRELQEELSLSVEPDDLTLLGSVYIDSGGKTSKHVALVYEYRASIDDVEVALNSEFFERQGTSLSGSFVDIEVLKHAVDVGTSNFEEWSKQILRNLLPPLRG